MNLNLARVGAGAGSLSAVGLILLALHEGFSPTPYKDSGGVWTDGFGNTHQVVPGKKVSVPEALERLNENASVAGKAVSRCISAPMTQNEYDAFVSFTYNVGEGAFCKSTMAKKFNAGDKVGACNEFLRWTFVAGMDCKNKANNCHGIVERRLKEKNLCLGYY